jgi:sec-independent protein translocase protein TatA
MRGLFEGWHLIILLVVVLVLFGYKRMPDAARSLGRSMRIFKSEVDSMRNDDNAKSGQGSDTTGSAGTGASSSGTQPLSGRIVEDGNARPQSTEPTGDERR